MARALGHSYRAVVDELGGWDKDFTSISPDLVVQGVAAALTDVSHPQQQQRRVLHDLGHRVVPDDHPLWQGRFHVVHSITSQVSPPSLKN